MSSIQKVLSDNLLEQSKREIVIPAQTEQKEEILGGVFALGKYEGKGFEINLAELLRRLRQFFKT